MSDNEPSEERINWTPQFFPFGEESILRDIVTIMGAVLTSMQLESRVEKLCLEPLTIDGEFTAEAEE